MRPHLGLLALTATLAVSVLCVTETPNVAAQKGNVVRAREASDRPTQRPPVGGRNGGASAGHPLTTVAAFEILLKGGNAFDEGLAAMLVGGVVEQDLYSLGGEGLVLVYPRSERKLTSVVGQGWAPKGATIDWYTARHKDLDGEGLDPAVIPGAIHAALTVLEKWGTMSFEQVSARAIEYARDGFPLRPRTAASIEGNLDFFKKWPGNQRYWLKPDSSMYKPGETIKLPTLAHTLTLMVEAERAAASKGRAAGVVAARDRFYKGDLAREMVAFLKQHQAPFELDDFAEFFAKIEEPATTNYRGYQIYKHSFGSQGPVLLEALNILEQFDLKSMKRNSADYIHTVIEALKLAYADRDTYYGDPAFVETPAEGLLSKDYARQRAALINRKRGALPGIILRQQAFSGRFDECGIAVIGVAVGVSELQRFNDGVDVVRAVAFHRLQIELLQDVQCLEKHRALTSERVLINLIAAIIRC